MVCVRCKYGLCMVSVGDKMSYQNASIVTNCERWPLMIDPQLQGIKWIKKKYEKNTDNFTVIRFDQKGFV